ncbi:hypothetical protein [Aeromicrobium sp. UC242_57]|uniref:hypothetical protein n=1 Tax=Aeromicrobium sp. UC242_57 TaxID=3374624 RepID=UPI00379BCA9E
MLIDSDRRPLSFGKTRNDELAAMLRVPEHEVEADLVVIEMVASYGMPVGADVF